MDWLETIFDVANLATSMSSGKKLKTLVQQGQSQELVAALIAQMKNEIFTYKQVMEEILGKEEVSGFSRALGMKLLANKLIESEISPEMFPDFSDKEYVSALIKEVKKNSKNLFENLSPKDKEELVRTIEDSGRDKEDYAYYIENFHEYKNFKERKEELKEINKDFYSNSRWKIPSHTKKNKEFEKEHKMGILERIDHEAKGSVKKARELLNRGFVELSKISESSGIPTEFVMANATHGLVNVAFSRSMIGFLASVQVRIDGQPVVELLAGQSFSTQVIAGTHTIQPAIQSGFIGKWRDGKVTEIIFDEEEEL